jgi:hypothetical protein
VIAVAPKGSRPLAQTYLFAALLAQYAMPAGDNRQSLHLFVFGGYFLH